MTEASKRQSELDELKEIFAESLIEDIDQRKEELRETINNLREEMNEEIKELKKIKNGIQLVDGIIKACEDIKDHKEIDYGHQINPWARPRYDD